MTNYLKGTGPILAENISAEEGAEATNQESEEPEGQGENNPTDGYLTRKGKITKKKFLSSRRKAVKKIKQTTSGSFNSRN
jgi:hypothetical protein